MKNTTQKMLLLANSSCDVNFVANIYIELHLEKLKFKTQHSVRETRKVKLERKQSPLLTTRLIITNLLYFTDCDTPERTPHVYCNIHIQRRQPTQHVNYTYLHFPSFRLTDVK